MRCKIKAVTKIPVFGQLNLEPIFRNLINKPRSVKKPFFCWWFSLPFDASFFKLIHVHKLFVSDLFDSEDHKGLYIRVNSVLVLHIGIMYELTHIQKLFRRFRKVFELRGLKESWRRIEVKNYYKIWLMLDFNLIQFQLFNAEIWKDLFFLEFFKFLFLKSKSLKKLKQWKRKFHF